MSTLNPLAVQGFAKASFYDTHRPSYPSGIVQALLEGLRVAGKNGATIVDLAAGTGKLTELLAHRSEQYKVIAIEPQVDMRKVLEDKKLPGVSVHDGLSTTIPLEDGSVDALVAAQAFHWFANMDSLKEIHRVLQTHGCFGMIWNVEDYNAAKSLKAQTQWEQQLHDFLWTIDDGSPRYRHEKWRQVFDDQLKSTPLSLTTSADPLFSLPLAEHIEEWDVWLPKDKVWERYTTISQISMLSDEERERAHGLFEKAITADDVRTNDKGEIAIHGRSHAAWTSKVPA